MIKILGLLTVFLSSSVFGLTLVQKNRRAAMLYAELVDFFTFLEIEIKRKRTIDSIVADFFSKGKIIKAGSRRELIDILNSESKYDSKMSLLAESADFLDGVGRTFNCESESASCLAFLEHSREIEMTYRNENKNRDKMYKKLGILTGLALCIIVW